jgi:hypothetical protein
MKKWLLVILLLLLAFWAGGKFGTAQATKEALAYADTAAAKADTAKMQLAEAARLQTVVDSMKKAYKPTSTTSVKWKTNWDTLWLNKPDTGTVTNEMWTSRLLLVRLAGDSAINSCHRAKADCEQLVASTQEVADSLRGAAQSWEEADQNHAKEADQWRKAARGPLFRLAVDGLASFEGDWRVAGDVQIGHGHLHGLVRPEIGNGQEKCEFEGDVYQCKTETQTSVFFGGRYTF